MVFSTTPDERLETVLETCAALGWKSVVCAEDFDEETARHADVYEIADWEDEARILEIAGREKIDGAVGVCDKAMLPVTRLTEALGLPGNPVESAARLLSKNDFRSLQEEAGVFCPRHFVTGAAEDLPGKMRDLRFPVIVKPLLCSSSHGMTVLKDAAGLPAAFAEASENSRDGRVCVEEYVANPVPLRIVEIDLFVVGDDMLWDGIRYCYRTERAPLRPVYDVYPADLSEEQLAEIRNTVGAVLRTDGVRLGEYNAEGFFTEEGRFFIVEINPRQAGHYNPQDIEFYCGVNLTKLLVTTACGDLSYYRQLKDFKRTRRFLLSYSVFSSRPGIFDHIHIDGSLLPKLREHRYLHGQKPGDRVLDTTNAIRPISKVVFEFDSAEELESFRCRIEELVYPVLRG